jgi:hypothetical protein
MGGPGMGPLREDQKWVTLLEIQGSASEASARELTKAIHALLAKAKKDKKIKGFGFKFSVVGGK